MPSTYRMDNRGAVTVRSEIVNLVYQEVITGTAVPAYAYKIAHLQDASSSYSRTFRVGFENGEWNLFIHLPIGSSWFKESLRGITTTMPPSPIAVPKASEIALGNFLTSASEALAPFKGGVFLGELRDTLKMIRNPADALRNGFSSYLKRARQLKQSGRNRKRLRKVLSQTWLEYCYGWLPLIGDLRSATKAYALLESRVETVRAFGKASAQGTSTSIQTNGHHANYLYWFETTKTVNSTSVIYKGVAKATPDGVRVRSAENLLNVLGFNLLEFVPTVWELIPYSFVVDMFSNVGDILNAGLGLTADWVWVSKSTVDQVEVTIGRKANITQIKASLGSNTQIAESGGPSKVTRSNYLRVYPILHLPTLTLEIPSSPWSWANLAALVGSKL